METTFELLGLLVYHVEREPMWDGNTTKATAFLEDPR